jgi:dUTP pyrophosphatase
MKIKFLNDLAKMPQRGSTSAAGFDIYSANSEPIVIKTRETIKIPTGFATEIPEGYFAAVFPRSGMATKLGLRLANCVAVIDSDYRGEWLVPLYNDSSDERVIEPGTRIAQFVVIPYIAPDLELTDNLKNTDRGVGGFGSTGTN